jgi:uncharacterized protein (DUF2236 family)
VAVALGAVAADVPRTWAALERYLAATYASGQIVVGQQARELGAAVLAPPLAVFIAPVAWLNRVVSVGLLPEHLRTQYGFAWGASDDRMLQRVVAVVERARRLAPGVLASWPEARRAG